MERLSGSRVLRRALAGSTALSILMGMSGAALAQDGAQGQPGASPEPLATPATPTADEGPEIVVTGSRIAREDLSADSPLVTISEDTLLASADVSLDQSLKELPQFAGGSSAVTGAASTQATPTNSPGIATLNLRGVGANRTLVLLDGRRTQPANATLVVDINTIPRGAIDGVEVITGGAGSTYGADAVAGVVNFKLKRNFTGLQIDGNFGITEEADGKQIDVQVLLGSDFDDGRGNAMVALGYQNREEIFQRDREFYQRGYADPTTAAGSLFFGSGYVLAPSTNTSSTLPGYPIAGFNFTGANAGGNPTQAAANAVFARYGIVPGDVPVTGAGANATLFFNKADNPLQATLFPALPGRVSGRPAPNYNGLDPNVKVQENGALGAVNRDSFLQLPLERYSLFTAAHYDVTDNIEAYVQGSFNHGVVTTQAGAQPAFQVYSAGITFDAATCGAAVGHPVPQDLCDILRSRPNPNAAWGLNQLTTFMGPGRVTTNTYTYEVLVGLRGDLPIKDWTFDVFGSRGKTSQRADYENFIDLDVYQTVIGLPNYGANSSFNNPRAGLVANCTSGLNPFTTAPVSQDCQDLIEAKINAVTDIGQTQAEANLQGGLFEAPGGEVRFAAGTSYRENSFHFNPSGPLDAQTLNSAVISSSGVNETRGTINVREIYGELLVPVVRDLPFIQTFTLNAGYRFSSYNTAGGVHTWKITGDWDVNDWVKIRGGYQVANRAPNVAEIFQPAVFTTGPWPGGDPCSRFAAQSSYPGYGNRPDNPDRARVLQLCSALAGGFPFTTEYVGNVAALFQTGRQTILGNPNLKSEEGKTYTIGAVIRSPFNTDLLRRLTLAVDYYNINIEGAVGTLDVDYVYRQCFNYDRQSNPNYDPNNRFCQRIIRDPTTGFWQSANAFFENLGQIATSGVDATLSWSIPAPGIGGANGNIFTNASFNYLDSFRVQGQPGGAFIEYRDTIGGQYNAQFRWRLNTTVGYDFGLGMISVNWRHLPSIGYYTTATSATATELRTPQYDIFDLAGRVDAADGVEVRFGIDNLFNQQPLRIGVRPGPVAEGGTSAWGSTDTSVYDVIGRRYYIGARLSF